MTFFVDVFVCIGVARLAECCLSLSARPCVRVSRRYPHINPPEEMISEGKLVLNKRKWHRVEFNFHCPVIRGKEKGKRSEKRWIEREEKTKKGKVEEKRKVVRLKRKLRRIQENSKFVKIMRWRMKIIAVLLQDNMESRV